MIWGRNSLCSILQQVGIFTRLCTPSKSFLGNNLGQLLRCIFNLLGGHFILLQCQGVSKVVPGLDLDGLLLHYMLFFLTTFLTEREQLVHLNKIRDTSAPYLYLLEVQIPLLLFRWPIGEKLSALPSSLPAETAGICKALSDSGVVCPKQEHLEENPEHKTQKVPCANGMALYLTSQQRQRHWFWELGWSAYCLGRLTRLSAG